MRRLLLTVITPILLLCPASAATAQSRESVSVGISGGIGIPIVDLTRYFDYDAITQAGIEFRIQWLPLIVLGADIGVEYLGIRGGGGLIVAEGSGRVGLTHPLLPWLDMSYSLDIGYRHGFLIDPANRNAGNVFPALNVSARFRLADAWRLELRAAASGWLALHEEGGFLQLFVGTRFHPLIHSALPFGYEAPLQPELLDQEVERSRLRISGLEIGEVFPVLYKYYEDHPFGTATIENTSDEPIEALRVELLVEGYMDAPMSCPAPEELVSGESIDVDLYALFSERVLNVTEGTKLTAKVICNYSVGDKSYRQEATDTLQVYARNEVTWDDTRKAAAFVTTRDPLVLQLARNSTGWAEAIGPAAVNRNLRIAMGIHETLRLYGMSYISDPSTPYEAFSQNATAVDFLQFPRETLLYRTGDCDDLSILYSALLQSLNIDTAFVTTPGHIFVAANLGVDAREARQRFTRVDDLIFIDEEAWLPIEVTALQSSFLDAWAQGAREWREATNRQTGDFVPIRQAWNEYRPVGLPAGETTLEMPSKSDFDEVYRPQIEAYVQREIFTQVADLQARIQGARDDTSLRNRLGVTYAQYGLYDLAFVQFDAILEKTEFAPAMVNKANILYLQEEFDQALSLYDSAIRADPDSTSALLGVARCHHQLENFGLVDRSYAELKRIDPELAGRFSYLDLRGEDASRAAEIAGVTAATEWDLAGEE